MNSQEEGEGEGEVGLSYLNPIDIFALISLIYILLIFSYKIYRFLWIIACFCSAGLIALGIVIIGYILVLSPYVLPLLWDIDGKLGGYLSYYVETSLSFRIVSSLFLTRSTNIPLLHEGEYLPENFSDFWDSIVGYYYSSSSPPGLLLIAPNTSETTSWGISLLHSFLPEYFW